MIRGERVVLRPVEESDYADIVRWQNDPEVFAAMDYEQPFSLDDIRDSEANARIEGYPFVIEIGVGQGARDGCDRRIARLRVRAT